MREQAHVKALLVYSILNHYQYHLEMVAVLLTVAFTLASRKNLLWVFCLFFFSFVTFLPPSHKFTVTQWYQCSSN